MNTETMMMERRDSSGFQRLLPSSSVRTILREMADSQNILYTENGYANKAWTSNFGKQRTPFTYESAVLDSIVRNNEKIREHAIDDATQKLVECFQLYNYDDDSEMFFWPVVDSIISETSISIFGAALQSIITKYNDYVNVLCAVAKCLCSFELEQTAEWGPMILIALLSHQNETVKEYAVFLLENWENRSLLPILRNLDCHATWLREYVDSVVASLEG